MGNFWRKKILARGIFGEKILQRNKILARERFNKKFVGKNFKADFENMIL